MATSSAPHASLIERVKNADILFVPVDGYKMAPARIRSYNFARELKRRGVKAEVLSFVDDFLTPDGVSYLPRNDWPSMDRYTLGKVIEMAEVLQHNPRCPIVLQKADFNLFSAAFAQAANGNKLILDYDDNDVGVFFLSNRLADRIQDFHPRHVLRHFAEEASCCIASSRELRNMLHAYNAETHLVYTVVDTEIFDYKLRGSTESVLPVSAEKVNIIWPGSVWNREMSQDVLLMAEAFLTLPEDVRSKAKLHMIGFGREWPSAANMVRTLADDYGAQNDISINNAVPPDAMPGIYAHMDIGLICLQSNAYTRAKSPTKMFEYMAMGLAVCASSGGEPGHILEDGVTGCVASTLVSYRENLSRLILDAAFRQRVADNGRDLVNASYSMRVAGDQLMKIFDPMLAA